MDVESARWHVSSAAAYAHGRRCIAAQLLRGLMTLLALTDRLNVRIVTHRVGNVDRSIVWVTAARWG
jgi:hypothetical protein